MRNKLLSILAIGLVLFLVGCSSKSSDNSNSLDRILQRGKIVVGVKTDTKPFGYVNKNNQLVGYDIDIARYIAKELLGSEDKVEFKPVTPANRILALNSGQVDMVIATMTITNPRKMVVDFSHPYYVTGQSILVPSGSRIKSMSDLNGKRVVIIFGTTAEKNLRLIAPEAKIIGFKTYTSGYDALKNGMADALTSDNTILMGFAMQDKSVKLLPQKYSQEPYAIAFKKGDTSGLVDKVNRIIDDLGQTGRLNQLKSKWKMSKY